MTKPNRMSDYYTTIAKENRFYRMNGSNIENGLNIYETEDGEKFFNLLATRVFPDEMVPGSYTIYRTNGGETLQNIAYNCYENIHLWWVVAEANHIENPFTIFTAGLELTIPNPATIAYILTEMRK